MNIAWFLILDSFSVMKVKTVQNLFLKFSTRLMLTGGNMGTWSVVYRIPRDNAAGGWGFDCPTVNLFNEFEPGDPETIYAFMFPGDVFSGQLRAASIRL